MNTDEVSPATKALQALLLLRIDDHLREHEPRKHREVGIERILQRAGYASSEIASLLGKTVRAVNMALED